MSDVLCLACGHDHNNRPAELNSQGQLERKPERKTWPLCEGARQQHESLERLPGEWLGDLPASFSWSRYKNKEAQRCERIDGSWADFAIFLHEEAMAVASLDKEDQPLICGPAHRNGRSTDGNAEAAHFLYFDSDDAGTWAVLKAFLERSGLAAIFNQSSSRRDARWHVRVPLATPVDYGSPEAVPGAARRKHKLAYRHASAVFSSFAGFNGTGGHCGFDLATDRLNNAQFLPLRRTPEDPPVKILLLPGKALDWETFLTATGFDLKAALELDGSKNQGPHAARPAKVDPEWWGSEDISNSHFGPLGLALEASGMLRRRKRTAGIEAACPFYQQHTKPKSGAFVGEWDAIYFDSSDTWWCSHHTCQVEKGPARRNKLIAALPEKGRELYKKLHDMAKTYGAREAKKAPVVAAASTWLKKKLEAMPQEQAHLRDRVLNAFTTSLLNFGLSQGMILTITKAVEPVEDALQRIQNTILRQRIGDRCAGASFLRRTLGGEAIGELVEVLYQDTGNKPLELGQALLGRGIWRGAEKDFLNRVHASLASDDVAKKIVIRPTVCRQFHDVPHADGKPIKAMGKDGLPVIGPNGKSVVVKLPKICESAACPCCFQRRLGYERDMLENGWVHIKKKRRRKGAPADEFPDPPKLIEAAGWKEQGPFWLLKLEDIASFKDLDKIEDLIKRSTVDRPRTKLLTFKHGKPAILLVTNEVRSFNAVSMLFRAWAVKHPGVTVRELPNLDWKTAIDEVMIARTAVLARGMGLIQQKADIAGTAEFFRFVKKSRLVSRSKGGLHFPTREDVRLASKDKTKRPFDPSDYASECIELSYVLYHTETDTKLNVQLKRPHTLHEVAEHASNSGLLRANLARLEQLADYALRL